jgi:hypothetical protein
MGTLANQRPRSEARNIQYATGKYVGEYVMDRVDYLINNHELTVEQALLVIAEERKQLDSEYWRNDLDVKDEQLAGFGELLQSLIWALENK